MQPYLFVAAGVMPLLHEYLESQDPQLVVFAACALGDLWALRATDTLVRVFVPLHFHDIPANSTHFVTISLHFSAGFVRPGHCSETKTANQTIG
jgi:hypothetical protein